MAQQNTPGNQSNTAGNQNRSAQGNQGTTGYEVQTPPHHHGDTKDASMGGSNAGNAKMGGKQGQQGNTAARGDDDLMSSDCGCGTAAAKDRPATRQAQTAVGTQATISEPGKQNNTAGKNAAGRASDEEGTDEADLGASPDAADKGSGIASAAGRGADKAQGTSTGAGRDAGANGSGNGANRNGR
ncbi:MAG TPA: hypothetical protein VK176_10645 [Phycisphaerales bacterium]|nr:hypothetical protein [Phycisphaerales bacterium]